MNNKTYTEEELKTILEDLSLHKQQVKDLEQNTHQALLQAQQYIASLEEEIAALQAQQNSLQQIATQSQEEKNKAQQEILLTLQQLEHYEESFSLLEEENQKLRQHATSHAETPSPASDAYKNLLQQCVKQQSQIEKLTASLQEKDEQLRSTQQSSNHIKQLISKKENLEEHLSKEIQLSLIAQEEKKFTDDRLAESQKHAEQLGRVIQFLRERLEEAHLEANQLQEDFKSAQEELGKLSDQLAASREENAHLQVLLVDTQEEKTDALNEAQALGVQFAKLKEHIALLESQRSDLTLAQQELKKHQNLAQTLQDELTKAHRTMEELRKNLETTKKNEAALEVGLQAMSSQEKTLQAAFKEVQQESKDLKATYEQQVQELQTALQNKQSLIDAQSLQLEELQQNITSLANEKERAEELEMNLKTAHVHLAKKVKEIALYQERYEEQKLHLHEMEEIHLQYESQLSEVNKNLETQHETERHLQEQIKKWEKQHQEVSEKLHKAEARAEELKEMELKHNQMQAFLKNMGALIAPLQASSAGSPSMPEQAPAPSEEQASLFDWSSHTPKHKQTFFD
ncbi:MAG: hypothetical protein CK425_05280 [Parachlamydia sp.]|nr:MAG: hypothetical protein CK425_05280 [Parachlamydia sp.]